VYQRITIRPEKGRGMNEVTRRSRMKAERRRQLVRAASRLFAERGFARLYGDLAAEAGVSGPAVYRHFASKEALLADLLIDVSEQLLEQGRQRATNASPLEALTSLVAFHTIRVARSRFDQIQDHDFANLALEDARKVSRLQRAYLESGSAFANNRSRAFGEVARTKIQAVFGLLNSTPTARRIATPKRRVRFSNRWQWTHWAPRWHVEPHHHTELSQYRGRSVDVSDVGQLDRFGQLVHDLWTSRMTTRGHRHPSPRCSSS